MIISKEKEFQFETASLGELFSFGLAIGHLQELYKRLGKDVEKSSPNDYVRTLISVSCHPKEKLIDGKYRPNNYSLSLEDANRLSDDDLEKFSFLYLEKNDSLYRIYLTTKQPTENSKETLDSFEYNDVEYNKKDNESYVEYLHRLSVKKEKRETERIKKLYSDAEKTVKQFKEMTGFSKTLQDQINSTLTMGNALRNSFEHARATVKIEPFPIKTMLPKIDSFGDIIRKSDEANLKSLVHS